MKTLAALSLLPILTVPAFADDEPPPASPGVVVQAPVVQMPVAPPVAAPAVMPNGAPQNEDWGNVSHINGTPVKVGERNDYLYTLKKTNVSANPFGPFFGYYDLGVSQAMSQNIALSGSLAYYDKSTDYDSRSMFQLTASAPIYFRRTFSGPFLEPGLIYRSSSSSDNYAYGACATGSYCGSNMSTHTWFGPELLFGWHWNFDSGLNISWAFGLAKHVSDSNNDGSTTSSDNPDVNGYFRVGYNF